MNRLFIYLLIYLFMIGKAFRALCRLVHFNARSQRELVAGSVLQCLHDKSSQKFDLQQINRFCYKWRTFEDICVQLPIVALQRCCC